MKLKLFLLVAFIWVTINSYGQSERSYSILYPPSLDFTEALGKKDENGNKTGVWKFLRSDGTMVAMISYQNGKRNGNKKLYWENGSIYSTCVYVDGLENGIEKIYMKNGYLAEITSFKNGLKDGEQKEFDRNGDVNLIANYKSDIEHGSYQKFYDGNLEESGNYLDGKKEGKWVTFYDGNLEESGNYSDGKKEGKWVTYDEGKIQLESEYKNGIAHGLWKTRFRYDEALNDKVEYEYQMINGKITNPIKMYEYNAYYSENTSKDPDEEYYEVKKYYWTGHVETATFSPTSPSLFTEVGEWNMKNMMGDLIVKKIVYDKEGNKLTESVYNKKGIVIEFYEYYKNGISSNKWSSYYDNGTLKSVRITDINDRDTMIKNYYEDGNIKFYFENLKGTDYYNSGKIKAKKEFIYAKRYLNIISLTEFHENGVIEVVKRYTGLTNNQGYPIEKGTWKYYDQNGNLIKTENFEDGLTKEND
jgi:antitoxin component YwqK of YwqJK toxin-antitoxin module